MPDSAEIILPDSNQVSLAAELGVVLEEDVSAVFVVSKIDEVLAEKSIEEQARWFVLSVLRHLELGQWSQPGASNLELPRQYSLARECLAIAGFKKSLTTVLKDKRYLFTLLTFGKSKDANKNILSSMTKAYKIAADVVSREELLLIPEKASAAELIEDSAETPINKNKELDTAADVVNPEELLLIPEKASVAELIEDSAETPISKNKELDTAADVVNPEELLLIPEKASAAELIEDSAETPESKNKELDTAANRRAGRRGYLSAELHGLADTHSPEKITTRKAQVSSMSEKEFLDLEAAIESNTQTPEQQEWNYRSNEDRWSLLLGLAAGVGFFSLIFILFL